ncbi:MAG: alpha-glucan family phosphorylase [Bacteroidales bacterium]
MNIQASNSNSPFWRDIIVKSKLPKSLEPLAEISKNIWWTWDYEAKELYASINKELWKDTNHNPVLMLELLDLDRLEELASDSDFLSRMNVVYKKFRSYVETPYSPSIPSVAYFSMEYGLANILKIYSGGLGVLAGDYLKEASDCAVDMTAVGFMYRYGYFTQALSMEGQQIANYEAQNFSHLPVEQLKDNAGSPIILAVPFPGRDVFTYIWKVNVGRISLLLMDTDLDLNSEFDRSITHQLYGGDWENRMKQEYLLGIGGILLLNKLGIKKDVYHCNEGHAALINLQRLVDFINRDNLSFNEALEVVRSSSLYTVHTPVPAGHDSFDEHLFGKYMYEFPSKLGIEWHNLMDMGRENPGSHEKFSMSVFACNTAQEVNGVSWLHGEVSKDMFSPIWKGYFPKELHVGYVTNGVHLPTWQSPEWQKFFKDNLSKDFWADQSNENHWEPIYKIPDEKIWNVRQALKNKLINYIKDQFKRNWIKNQLDPTSLVSIIENINPNALIIGFGRRFATYKRAHLLFTDLDRLSRIVNNPKYPVLFFFTGKAHPADGAGQALIKQIVEISRRPEFVGKIIFLENYDMQLAKRLIAGVDIWLNTPTRPLEASGTSGEKAEMNGVLNFSVKDGWWFEGYREGAGWALTEKRTYKNQMHQDQLDAATIYATFEREIIPLYFAFNSKGYSPEWVQCIKNSFVQIAPHYTTKRMLDDYIERFYTKLAERHAYLEANNFQKAKEMAKWKSNVVELWPQIQILSVDMPDLTDISLGSKYKTRVVLDTKGLADAIGVELVAVVEQGGVQNIDECFQLDILEINDGVVTYQTEFNLSNAGGFKLGLRMYPKHKDLPHRQDLCYVRWF